MQTSANEAPERVRTHFRRKAFSFDALYDEERALQRALRGGLFRRRELALKVVHEYDAARVLDVGCGSGRIAELALEAGASELVGVDPADEMLGLARERLSRFGERVQLVHGDFREAELVGPFDVVLGLGLFDYLPDADVFVKRMGALSSGSAVASFPKWSFPKSPVRKLRYEVVNNCPIFDYTEEGVEEMFREAGFARVGFVSGRSGFVARADK